MSGSESLIEALQAAGLFASPAVTPEQLDAAQDARKRALELLQVQPGPTNREVLGTAIAASLPMAIGGLVGGAKMAGLGGEGAAIAINQAQKRWEEERERGNAIKSLIYQKAESDWQNLLNKQVQDQQKRQDLIRALYVANLQDARADRQMAAMNQRTADQIAAADARLERLLANRKEIAEGGWEQRERERELKKELTQEGYNIRREEIKQRGEIADEAHKIARERIASVEKTWNQRLSFEERKWAEELALKGKELQMKQDALILDTAKKKLGNDQAKLNLLQDAFPEASWANKELQEWRQTVRAHYQAVMGLLNDSNADPIKLALAGKMLLTSIEGKKLSDLDFQKGVYDSLQNVIAKMRQYVTGIPQKGLSPELRAEVKNMATILYRARTAGIAEGLAGAIGRVPTISQQFPSITSDDAKRYLTAVMPEAELRELAYKALQKQRGK